MTLQEKYDSITCPTGFHKMSFDQIDPNLSQAHIDAITVGNFCYDNHWNTLERLQADPSLAASTAQKDKVNNALSILLPFNFPLNNLMYAGIGYAVAPKGSEVIYALLGAAVPFAIYMIAVKNQPGVGF